MGTKQTIKRVWHFLWKSDSPWSWLANIIIAFLLIRFLLYPGLGLILGTSFPIVAVVSESMEHGLHNQKICGLVLDDFKDSFDNYWQVCGSWYEQQGISAEEFQKFPFANGFNTGDIILVYGAKPEKLQIGDILIFNGNRPQPVIHRLVDLKLEDGEYYFTTKGDHNKDSLTDGSESMISADRLLGKAALRIPYLGYIKILFVKAVAPFGWSITK